MLDTPNFEMDNLISDHVIQNHRYRNPSTQDGEVLVMDNSSNMRSTKTNDIDTYTEDNVYEKYNPNLHGPKKIKIIKSSFLKKYIAIAKCIKPNLTNEACAAIIQEYGRLRSQEYLESDAERIVPVTPRTIESLIRLATAYAKGRFSKNVDVGDVNFAIDLVKKSYYIQRVE